MHLIAFYTKTYKRHTEDLYYKDCTVSQFIFLPPNNLVIPQRNRRPCNTVIYSRTDFLVKRKVNKIQLQRLVLLLSFKGGLLTFKKNYACQKILGTKSLSLSSLRACDCLICMVAFSPPGLLLIHIRLRFRLLYHDVPISGFLAEPLESKFFL